MPADNYNMFLLQPYQTVLVRFKDNHQFIARLDPAKTLSIYDKKIKATDFLGQPDGYWYHIQESKAVPAYDPGRLDYNAINQDGTGDVGEVVMDSELEERLRYNHTFNGRNMFARQKQARKVREKQACLCYVTSIGPYNYAQYKFYQILSAATNLCFLSGASLGYCAQFLNLLSGQTRALVVDDYDGIATAYVVHRLYLEYFGQLHYAYITEAYGKLAQSHRLLYGYISSIIKAVYECYQSETPYNAAIPTVCAVQYLQREFFQNVVVPAMQLFNIHGYTQSFVLYTGYTSAVAVKNTLVDCNLIPCSPEHFQDQRQRYHNGKQSMLYYIPPVFSLHVGSMINRDVVLSDYCYTGELDPRDTGNKHLSLDKLVAYEYYAWFERRMQLYGLDGFMEASRIFNLRWENDAWVLLGRKQFNSYVAPDFVSANTNILPSMDPEEYQQELPHVSFNSVFMALRSRPLVLFRHLMQYVESGAPCVVFHYFYYPLVELADYLLTNKLACRVGAADVLEIQQQVLPGRSHPVMVGQVSGGYVMKFYAQGEAQDGEAKLGTVVKKRCGKIRK